jgi:hypothetical protein
MHHVPIGDATGIFVNAQHPKSLVSLAHNSARRALGRGASSISRSDFPGTGRPLQAVPIQTGDDRLGCFFQGFLPLQGLGKFGTDVRQCPRQFVSAGVRGRKLFIRLRRICSSTSFTCVFRRS